MGPMPSARREPFGAKNGCPQYDGSGTLTSWTGIVPYTRRWLAVKKMKSEMAV